MNDSQQKRVHSDFKIITSGKSFPVHRYTLHQSSEYFRAMLSHGMKELSQGYCEVSHDAIAVEQCIEFMYNKTIDLQPTTVASILKLSHEWLLDGAVARCFSFMQRNVSADNCVEWINVSKLYGLHKLESTCISFLLRNVTKISNVHDLDLKTLQSLADPIQSSPDNAKILWNIIQVRIQLPECNNPCRLIQGFHVENVSKTEYQSCILKNEHIVSCASCKEYITKRRQAQAYKIEDVTVENCLFIKYQVVKYEARYILNALDKYIVKHFQKVCMKDEFLTLVSKEDLLEYIRKIHRSCTNSEFARIVEWFRNDSRRENFFRKIFTLGRGVSSKFKNCLHTLTGADSEFWLLDPSNCCYLRYLAEKHSCRYILDETKYFLDENFETVSTSVDIAYLSVETMESYAKTESLYDKDDGLTMWNAVRLWAKNEERHGAEELSLVFCSFLFHKFSLSLLQQICNDNIVQKSTVCCSKLVEITLSRISQNRNAFANDCKLITHHMSVADAKLQGLEKRSNLANVRNDHRQRMLEATANERWQCLSRRCNDLQESVGKLGRRLEEMSRNFSNRFQNLRKDVEDTTQELHELRRDNALLHISLNDFDAIRKRDVGIFCVLVAVYFLSLYGNL